MYQLQYRLRGETIWHVIKEADSMEEIEASLAYKRIVTDNKTDLVEWRWMRLVAMDGSELR